MSEYNITLPYTGFGSQLRAFLPREKSCLSVFDNQTVILGRNNRMLTASAPIVNAECQYNSIILGGINNCLREDRSNYPYTPVGIRDGVGAGSGVASSIIGGTCNRAYGDYNIVLGGSRNCAYQQASVILGGLDNEVGGRYNVVINGTFNCIQTGTSNSFIIGGTDNIITTCSVSNGIIGGINNRIAKNSSQSIILGGAQHVIGGEEVNLSYGVLNLACGTKGANACYSYIIGGYSNTIYSGNCYSSILGGANNIINASNSQKADVLATGWSHLIVSNYSCINSNLSFILGGDSARICNNANKSFIIGANACINAPYSYVIGGTAVSIKQGDQHSAVISQQVNHKNITSRGPQTLLLNFESGVYISDNLNIEGSLILRSTNAPTSPNASGIKGQFALDDNYMYYCNRDNNWVRTAFSEWTPSTAKPGPFDFYVTSYSGTQSVFAQDENDDSKYIPSIVYAYEENYLQLSNKVVVRPLFDKYKNSPNLNQNALTYSVYPALTGRLVLNPTNGIITGFVGGIGINQTINHTITATNSAGSSSGVLTINYAPTVDTTIATTLNQQNQWLQGCGCGCAGGIGAGSALFTYYVLSTTTQNTNADISIRVWGVSSLVNTKRISYSTDGITYTNVTTSSTSTTDLTYSYTTPYVDQNLYIKLEIYNSAFGPGGVNSATVIYRYNPVQATSNFT
jgi:hypothetical protein